MLGNYTYPGPTVVLGGTLQLGDGTVPNDVALSTSSMTNNAAVVYDVGGSLTPSYSMSGVGSLTKTGSGTLTLNLANTYSGNTLVSQGTLLVGNSLALQNSVVRHHGHGHAGLLRRRYDPNLRRPHRFEQPDACPALSRLLPSTSAAASPRAIPGT